jgi:hypothetical protein
MHIELRINMARYINSIYCIWYIAIHIYHCPSNFRHNSGVIDLWWRHTNSVKQKAANPRVNTD